MRKNKSYSNRARNQKKKMEMDRAHIEETNNKSDSTGSYMEPTGCKTKRKTQKHLEKGCRKGEEADRGNMEYLREDSQRQKGVERTC